MSWIALALVLSTAPLTAQTMIRLWDREITAQETGGMNDLKNVALMVEETFEQQYLRKNGLEPPQEAFSSVRKGFQAAASTLRQPATSADDKTVKWANQFQERFFVQRIVRSFYLSRALWKKHGGRIVLSAFGICLAKDGLVQEMRALEGAGLLTFPGGTKLRDGLYRYILDQPGDGVVEGERAREFLAKPSWESWPTPAPPSGSSRPLSENQ